MLPDDNSEVRDLELRYPTESSWLKEAFEGTCAFAALLVLGAGAVGTGVIIAHFIVKFW